MSIYRPRDGSNPGGFTTPRPPSGPRPRPRPSRSLGSRLMSGIGGIGSDLAMGFGLKEKTDDYRRRTANTMRPDSAHNRML